MKKIYEEPEIQIRNYVLPVSDVVMTSTLTDGDNYGGDGDGSGYNFRIFSKLNFNTKIL